MASDGSLPHLCVFWHLGLGGLSCPVLPSQFPLSHTHTYTHAHKHTHVHTHTYVHTYIHTHVYTHALTCTHMHTLADGNTRFYGNCKSCHPNRSVCAEGEILEGSVALWLPDWYELKALWHPWRGAYQQGVQAR